MSDKVKLIRDRILFVLVLAGVLFAGYHFFYKPAVEARENAEAMNRQNTTAFSDLMSKTADSIQTLASQVGRLNEDLTRSQRRAGYWSAVASNLQIIVDSLKNSGASVASSGEDSAGTYFQVAFAGHRGILNYDGYTRYYDKDRSFHSLTAWFDSILVSSRLFQDTDRIWKIRTESHTPGVKLRATSTIDSTIFIGMRSAVEDEIKQSLDILPPFGVEANLGVYYTTKDQKLLPDVQVLGYYKNYYVSYHPLLQGFSGGLRYRFDLGNFIERIF